MVKFGIRTAVLSTIAVIALSGCASTANTAGPARSAPASPSPTSAPSRPALSDLVLSPDGLGPLVLGSPVAEQPRGAAVVTWNPWACTGDAAKSGKPYDGAWVPNYTDPDAATDFGDGVPFSFIVKNKTDAVEWMSIWSPEIATAEGISVGDTVTELAAAYPHFATVVHLETTDLYVLRGIKGQLIFEVATKYDANLTAWNPSAVGTIVWAQLGLLDQKPFSMTHSDVGGVCLE
jgi:hypothetical protein